MSKILWRYPVFGQQLLQAAHPIRPSPARKRAYVSGSGITAAGLYSQTSAFHEFPRHALLHPGNECVKSRIVMPLAENSRKKITMWMINGGAIYFITVQVVLEPILPAESVITSAAHTFPPPSFPSHK